MIKKILSLSVALVLLCPAGALAYQRETSKAGLSAETAPSPQGAPEETPKHEEPAQEMKGAPPPKHVPRQMTEQEYEKKMKSAQHLATAGFVMAIAGGAAAIAGSAYAIAKRDDRLVGGIIGVSGLVLGLTGGLFQIWGYNKRQDAQQGWTYSMAPAIDPSRRAAALSLAVNF